MFRTKKKFVNCCFTVFAQFLTKLPEIYIYKQPKHNSINKAVLMIPEFLFWPLTSKYDLVLSLGRTLSPFTLPLMVSCVIFLIS